MKKTLLLKVGVVLASVLFFLTSCNGFNSHEYDGKTDTVLTLSTPSVKGKAYPGVNYVYWDKVANAKNGYRMDIYENGVLIDSQSKEFDENTTYFIDKNLQNGVEKTYSVAAKGDTQARALYYTESSKGSVKLKGIVPPTDTSANNLVLYEKGYDSSKEYELTEKDVILTEENITVTKNEEDNLFSISFPAKPYLEYTIYAECGNNYEKFGKHSAPVARYENIAIPTDTEVSVDANVSTSGDYTIYVKASSINAKYGNSDEVKAKDSISYSTIDLKTSYSAIPDMNMSVCLSSTEAVIYWTPAKLLNGQYVPTSYYKIYKTVTGENKYSLVDSTVEEYTRVSSTAKLYCIKDSNIDSSKTYTYRFVITDGKKFANVTTEATSIIHTPVITGLTSDLAASYKDASTIKLTWTPNTLADGSLAPVSAYTVYRKVKGADDSTYAAVSAAITSETTVLGSTKYVVEDTITNNAIAYVYLLSLANGSDKAQKAIEIASYKESFATLSSDVTASYKDASTIKLAWTPNTLADGSAAPVSAYKVYRKVKGSDDSSYAAVSAAITKSTVFGTTTYIVEDAVSDNTVAYVYLLALNNGSATLQKAVEIASYKESFATLSSDVTASYKDASTIKLVWTPNTLADGSAAPVSAYKVYRKVQGSDDSTYAAISASIVSETTVLGSTKYVVEDTITNNAVAYVYLLTLDNGSANLRKAVTVSIYKESIATGNSTVSVSYIKDDTARILWTPAVIDGVTLSTTDYELYRKDFYSADTTYARITDTIKSAYTQSNKVVYYVDSVIADTASAYKYLLIYRSNNVIYQNSATLAAYNKAVVLATPTVTVYAEESDGIENDVKIELKVSAEQELEAVKYIKLASRTTTSLLDSDYPNVLKIADATSVTEEDTITHTWILSDVEEGTYISVVAIVDDNASFVTTTKAAASEPALTTSTINSGISIELLDNDDDGLKDDAFVIITLADNDKMLSAVTYASADSKEAAIEAAATGTSLTLSNGYRIYAFTIENAVSSDAPYFAISAVISEEGKKDAVITKDVTYTKATATIEISDIGVVDFDDDGLVNDIYFGIAAASEQKISIVYAISNTAANAKKLLESEEVELLTSDLTGYKFYEFSPENYEALQNLPLGKYIAVGVLATDDDATDTYSVIKTSATATYDAYAGARTDAPLFTMKKIAADEDGLVNDIYFTIEIYKTQTVEELIYATASEGITDLEKLRLDSEKITNIKDAITKKYETADKVIYEALIKDLEVGTCAAAKVTVGETDKVSASVTKTTTAVTEDIVVLSTTADIYADQTALYFTASNLDSKYNDIRQDIIHLTLGIDQSIKSIRWANAETVAEAKKLLRTDSTKATSVTLPQTYQLNTSVSYGVSTLTKTYSLTVPYIRNIPDGNYVVASIIISEPGKLDNEMFIQTETWTWNSSYPETDSFDVPATAWERPLTYSYYSANDSKNYEYVHVQIKDYFLNDSLSNYTYKLERTYEDIYNNSDAVWETIESESEISLAYDYYDGYYKFDKWYKDIPVGKYVYRLTKTRISSGDKRVTDIAVNVVYNVDAPTLSFSSYESENLVLAATEYMNPNYDYLDKYNYSIKYYVEYKDAYGYQMYNTNYMTLESWSWDPVLDDDGNETGYYTLKDAVISDVTRYNNCSTAIVHPYICKTRKINSIYTDYEFSSLTLYWGLSASIASSSDIAIQNYYESTVEGTTYLIVEADSDYDSYTWYVDSVNQDVNDKIIYINKASLSYGSHDILVVATKDGISYSTSMSYTK